MMLPPDSARVPRSEDGGVGITENAFSLIWVSSSVIVYQSQIPVIEDLHRPDMCRHIFFETASFDELKKAGGCLNECGFLRVA
jgi:hypothetical protein